MLQIKQTAANKHLTRTNIEKAVFLVRPNFLEGIVLDHVNRKIRYRDFEFELPIADWA
jgi:hypothetical protein